MKKKLNKENDTYIPVEYDYEHLKVLLANASESDILLLEEQYVNDNYHRFLNDDEDDEINNELDNDDISLKNKQNNQDVSISISSDTDHDTINATVHVGNRTVAYSNEGKQELNGSDLNSHSKQGNLRPTGNEYKQIQREFDDIDKHNKVGAKIGQENSQKNNHNNNVNYHKESNQIIKAKEKAKLEFRSIYKPEQPKPQFEQKRKQSLNYKNRPKPNYN